MCLTFRLSGFKLSHERAKPEVSLLLDSKKGKWKMKPTIAIVEEPIKVRVRIKELGLTEKILNDALRAGITARSNCTEHHPRNYPGIVMWAEIVRFLGDALKPLGWKRSDKSNFPLVVREDGQVAIAVAGGDNLTGSSNPTAKPSSRHPRGRITEKAVKQNAYPFLPFNPPVTEEIKKNTSTWFLLHSRQGTQVLCELSLPTDIDNLGYFKDWHERILLNPIQIDPEKLYLPKEEPIHPEISVKIRGNIS
jgi:hypothetical protein